MARGAERSAPHYDASRIADGLGTRWKIAENGYKLYSCCAHTHTAVDCALDARGRRGWSSHDVLRQVSGVGIETYGPGYEIVKEMNPRTPYQAKFSLAYCVAATLLEGTLGLEQFGEERFGPDGVRDAAIADLLRRVTVTAADDLTAKYPSAWPVRLTLSLNDGATERGASQYPRGNPENPVSTEELEQKCSRLITTVFGRHTTDAMLGALRSIERCPNMSDLFAPALVS
jgi:2-methylcitrate dehydratase PrpD